MCNSIHLPCLWLKLQALTYGSSYKVPECDCLDICSIHPNILTLSVHLNRWDNQRCSGHTVAHHCNCLERRTHVYDIWSWPNGHCMCLCCDYEPEIMPHNSVWYSVQGFIQDFFHGRGKCQWVQWAHACIGAPTGFCKFHEILDIFNDKETSDSAIIH